VQAQVDDVSVYSRVLERLLRHTTGPLGFDVSLALHTYLYTRIAVPLLCTLSRSLPAVVRLPPLCLVGTLPLRKFNGCTPSAQPARRVLAPKQTAWLLGSWLGSTAPQLPCTCCGHRSWMLPGPAQR
jgi:hypothetical protein